MDKHFMHHNLSHFTIIMCTISITLLIMAVFIIILVAYLEQKFKMINNDLYYNKEIFHALGSNIDNVIFIYDCIDKKYEYISPNFEKTLEINRDVLINGSMKIFDYIPEAKRKSLLRMFSNSNSLGTMEEDFEYIRPLTKEKCWIMIRVYPIFQKDRIIRYICITTDITKEKLYQKALEEALNNLKKANEAKKTFLSHMSHELKTPINAILAMSKMASFTLEDQEKTEDYLNKINFSSKKLLTLINNILDISKIDSEKLILVKEPFQLTEVLSSFSSIMNMQADLNHKEYTFLMNDIRDDFLMGDSLRLIQIMENCVSNSIKFTPTGGKIYFRVTETEKLGDKAFYCFTISDTGKGMSEQYLNHLFAPFEQEDNTIAKKYGGTGIGMTIAKELVDLMGGDIKVTSKVNIGTTYTIKIAFQVNENLPEEEKEKTSEPVLHDLMGKRALVVEDNDINREIISEILKRMNLEVETATNGKEALELFENSKQVHYDVILLDLQMPVLDGYETAKAIRHSFHPDSNTIKIIALTADDFSDSQLSMNYGMNYHITKAIDIENFYNIIQNVMTCDE